jgi:hypothetical protein
MPNAYTAANHSPPAGTPLGSVLALTALPLTEQHPFVTLPQPLRRHLARLFRRQALPISRAAEKPKSVTLSPKVVPDATWPGMYRMRRPDGSLTDMVNLTRAKDVLAGIEIQNDRARSNLRID